MKKREWIILPLLSAAVGAGCCAWWIITATNTALTDPRGRLAIAASAVAALIFLAFPGVMADEWFRKYPERVRLSPVSFGLIAAMLATLAGGFGVSLLIGNAVIAGTILAMANFKPGPRLGEFEKIPFRDTVRPALIAVSPLLLLGLFCLVSLVR